MIANCWSVLRMRQGLKGESSDFGFMKDEGGPEWLEDAPEQDPYAATRRAITRAAAELGKMKGEKES